MKNYLKLIRVKHYVKNILVALPMICASLFNLESIGNIAIGFLSFSFLASFIYIINDINDVENDRKHPKKKNRPIASGKVSIPSAIIIAIVLLLLSLTLNTVAMNSLFNNALFFLFAYLIINIAYSFGLKNAPIIDVLLLASGFVIRIYYGAAIVGVEVSKWLFLTTLSASLYLGLGKRKKELLVRENVREVLKYYNETYLNNFMNIFLCLIIVFYSLWVMEQGLTSLYFSIPMLIVIFMQYSLFIENNDEGDPTTVILHNKSILATVLLYGIFMIYIMVIK